MSTRDELEERIRAAYAAEEHRTSDEELGRIRARQAELTGTKRGRSLKPFWIAAAAVLVLGVGGTLALVARRPKTRNPAAALAADALLPSALMAQGASFPSFPVVTSSREIRPGEMQYAFLAEGHAFTDSTPVMRSRLEHSDWKGEAAWLLLGGPTGDQPPRWRDSAWFDTLQVRQLARSISVYKSNARIVEEFREHDVLRGYITEHGTSWNVLSKEGDSQDGSGGMVLRSDALNLALRRAPIDRDWKGSIALVVWPYYKKLEQQWYDLSVIGEERVAVPAGTFDCWKIQLGPKPAREEGIFFWVTRDKQWIAQWGAINQHGMGFRMVLVKATEE